MISFFDINASGIKNALKSKGVRKAVKDVTDTLDINK